MIFFVMGYDSSLSDPWNISYLMSSVLLKDELLWWSLGLCCSLLREGSCFSTKIIKCFCLTQFVGLSISYLGEMVVNGRM